MSDDLSTIFEILDYDHPEFGWYLSVDDEVAWEEDRNLDALAEALNSAPGVREAFREDREILLVGGTITHKALTAWVANWWNSRPFPPEVLDDLDI